MRVIAVSISEIGAAFSTDMPSPRIEKFSLAFTKSE
jgi:hypothetical protein